MQNTDLAWLAGIWEGEGTIAIFSHQEKNGITKICPCCSVVNTDLALINKVRKILQELGCNFTLKEYNEKNRKKKWVYRTQNQRYIILFLEAILPYIYGNKKANAEIVLDYTKQRLAKIERLPSKGTTKYDETDWSYLTKFRSSQTTREAPTGEDIVGLH